MLAEGNIAGWNSPFRQTAVSVSTSKQERMMKKKIGFIDLFIDEWHANHYPDWFRKARRAEEFELGLAWERAPFENRRPLEAWCRDFGMTPARSIEEVVEKSDAVCVLAPANPEVHLELADHALRSAKPVYVDKPFADSLRTAKEIFDIAEKYGTPLMSTSALRCSDELLDGKVKALEPFLFSVTGGGRSFAEYAIHQLEMIVSVMGVNVRKLSLAGDPGKAVLTLQYDDGRLAVLNYAPRFPFSFAASGATGSLVCPAVHNEFPNLINAMLDFFATGVSPIPKEQTLCIAALLEKSVALLNQSKL